MVTQPKSIVLVVALGVGVLAGCAERPSAHAKTPQEADDMWAHFDRAEEIRHAVIVGDMDQVAEPAGWLESNALSGELQAGAPDYAGEIRRLAGMILAAADVPGVAAGLGQMGVTCAGCHQAKAVGPEPYAPRKTEPSRSIVGHMDRHLWAANQLWAGLITPSENAWTAGAEALSDDPLGAQELPSVIAYDLVPIAERLHDLGDRAARTKDLARRGEVYGELISTCGECHTAVWRSRTEPQ